ncbi:MAG: transcriptional regulator, partial [Flavobacteriaceae bacterium]
MENKEIVTDKNFQNIFELANSSRDGICPVRDIIARISDKWTLLAIYALGGYGKMRFNELKQRIGDVSQRMLTVTLRNLESDGLVNRKVFPEVPPRVEYELTSLGISLMNQMKYIIDWANENGEEIIK